jgi:hypothetical protein
MRWDVDKTCEEVEKAAMLDRGHGQTASSDRLAKCILLQANRRVSNFVKNPPPTMKFRGECNLTKNGSPGSRAAKVAVGDGFQKFTSSTRSLDACSWNQAKSVTPTKSRM